MRAHGGAHLWRFAAGAAVTLCVLGVGARSSGSTRLGPHEIDLENPCGVCHDTAQGTATLVGYVNVSHYNPRLDGITSLCLSCHRWGSAFGASPMLRLAADERAHGLTVGSVWSSGSWLGGERRRQEAYEQTGLPYTKPSFLQLRCTTCHNVHVVTDRPFNRQAGIEMLCRGCHSGRDNTGRVGAENGAAPEAGYSTHPTGVIVADLPGNGPTAFEKVDPRLTVKTGSPDWQGDPWVFGGHLVDPTSDDAARTPFSCQTCHAVHGSAERPGEHGPGLPAIFEPGNPSALCRGCHRIAVGHPTSGVAGSGRLSPAAFPAAGGVPAAWRPEQHYDRGATPFDRAASEAPACTSCHDVHGGLPGTSLLFGPDTGGGGEGSWCFNCHPAQALLPAGHQAPGDGERDVPECGRCHRAGGDARPLSWRAHRGFGEHGPAPAGK